MTSDFERLRAEAEDSVARQDWPEACDRWAAVRDASPEIPLGFRAGMEAAVKAYRFDEVRRLETELETRFPKNFNIAMTLADLSCRRADWATAMARFDAVRAHFPRRFDAEVETTAQYRQAVLNTRGILAGNRELPLLLNGSATPGEVALPDRQGFVFVSGMPRAGTTALGHLLNISPQVALFTELYWPYRAYVPESFAPDVLAQRLKRVPAAAPAGEQAKAEKAAFVGDKRPLFHFTLPQTLRTLADQRVVVFHILRDCADVVASYQKRADDPADPWDPLRTAENCIHELNITHRFIRDMAAGAEKEVLGPKHELVYVDYDRVFTDPEIALSLFRTLGVDSGPAVQRRIAASQEKSRKVMGRPRVLSPKIRAALEAGIDREAAEAVREITGCDVLAGLKGTV